MQISIVLLALVAAATANPIFARQDQVCGGGCDPAIGICPGDCICFKTVSPTRWILNLCVILTSWVGAMGDMPGRGNIEDTDRGVSCELKKSLGLACGGIWYLGHVVNPGSGKELKIVRNLGFCESAVPGVRFFRVMSESCTPSVSKILPGIAPAVSKIQFPG